MSRTHTHPAYVQPEQAAFWVLVSLLVGAVCLYVYFIMSSVFNVVLRQELAQEVRDAETRISALEAQYLALNLDVTRERAEDFGLVELASVSYVSLEGSQVLTMER